MKFGITGIRRRISDDGRQISGFRPQTSDLRLQVTDANQKLVLSEVEWIHMQKNNVKCKKFSLFASENVIKGENREDFNHYHDERLSLFEKTKPIFERANWRNMNKNTDLWRFKQDEAAKKQSQFYRSP